MKSSKKLSKNFAQKLQQILQNPSFSNIIKQDKKQSIIQILDEQMLLIKVLPLFFRHNRLDSFFRQFHLYGFIKMRNKQNHAFYHKKLHKGYRVSELKTVKLVTNQMKKRAKRLNNLKRSKELRKINEKKQLLKKQQQSNNIKIQQFQQESRPNADKNYRSISQNQQICYLQNQTQYQQINQNYTYMVNLLYYFGIYPLIYYKNQYGV